VSEADAPAPSQQELRRAAMGLQARREHAVAELARKLIAKGHPREAVHDVVEALRQEGLVSDERFAEAFVRYRAQQGYGPLRIQAELRERGVSDDIQAVYLELNHPRWLEQIAQVRVKRFGARLPADFKQRAQQARFLQYRGYTGEQVRRVLDDAGEID
jgi:regulatory protein